MHRNITIDEKAYNLLASLKTEPRDSFTKVILRHVRKPANTCGELLEALENSEPPQIDEAVMKKFLAGRGRRSNRTR
jgi:predicted CopG family antitoxin